MKKILLAVIMLFPTLCQAQWSNWTSEQRHWYVASNIMLLADWATTRDMSRRYDEGYRERNVILGSRPSTEQLDLYFASVLIGHYFLTDWLSNKNRDIYLIGITMVEGSVVFKNFGIGLRMKF